MNDFWIRTILKIMLGGALIGCVFMFFWFVTMFLYALGVAIF